MPILTKEALAATRSYKNVHFIHAENIMDLVLELEDSPGTVIVNLAQLFSNGKIGSGTVEGLDDMRLVQEAQVAASAEHRENVSAHHVAGGGGGGVVIKSGWAGSRISNTSGTVTFNTPFDPAKPIPVVFLQLGDRFTPNPATDIPFVQELTRESFKWFIHKGQGGQDRIWDVFWLAIERDNNP